MSTPALAAFTNILAKFKATYCACYFSQMKVTADYLYQTLSDFFGRKRVLYLNTFPPSPTPSRRPPWACVRRGLMDWYPDLVPYLYLVYWIRTVQVWTGTFMRYTRDTIGTGTYQTREGGEFFWELSLRHSWTDKFSGTGSPARQI